MVLTTSGMQPASFVDAQRFEPGSRVRAGLRASIGVEADPMTVPKTGLDSSIVRKMFVEMLASYALGPVMGCF